MADTLGTPDCIQTRKLTAYFCKADAIGGMHRDVMTLMETGTAVPARPNRRPRTGPGDSPDHTVRLEARRRRERKEAERDLRLLATHGRTS